MRSKTLLIGALSLVLFAATTVACGSADTGASTDDEAITSNEARIVDFAFDGEVTAAAETVARTAITTQLFYTIGMLTTEFEANGEVGRVELTGIQETVSADPLAKPDQPNTLKRIKYKAKLPVAWPKGKSVPRTLALTLPRDVRSDPLNDFDRKYDSVCGKSEYQNSFWHNWSPEAPDAASTRRRS